MAARSLFQGVKFFKTFLARLLLGGRVDGSTRAGGGGAARGGRLAETRRASPAGSRAAGPSVDVGDHYPVLVGWRAVVERPQCQRFQRPGAARIGAPAGLTLRVEVTGPIKRNPVPPSDRHPWLEVPVAYDLPVDLGDDVFWRIRRTIDLDQKGQGRDRILEPLRSEVLRVCITETIDHERQFAMELEIKGGDLLAEMLDGPQDVKAVEGSFEWQMCIHPVQYLCPGIEDIQPSAPAERKRWKLADFGGQQASRVAWGRPSAALTDSGAPVPLESSSVESAPSQRASPA